jgi:hypothetical protein
LLNRDFVEMLRALSAEGVECLLVGAYAMAAHGTPRATGDLDLWVRPTRDNAERVLRALRRFGAPLFDLTVDDLACPGTVFQLGLPPRRIDILTSIDGVKFAGAWAARVTVRLDDVEVAVLGRRDLIRNKRATGRPKDRVDLRILEGGAPGRRRAAIKPQAARSRRRR